MFALHRMLQFIVDTVLILWFFRRIPVSKPTHSFRSILAYGFLASLFFLHVGASDLPIVLRFLDRVLVYVLFLYLHRGASLCSCIYTGAFAAICITACHNIFFTPLLYGLTSATIPLVDHPIVNSLVCSLLIGVLQSALLLPVFLLLPAPRSLSISPPQWMVLCAVILCELYTKYTMHELSQSSQVPHLELSIFPIALHLLLLAFLVFFERYLYSAKAQQEIYAQEIINNYRIRQLEHKQAGDADLRRLYHDMKNHLLAIRSLACEEHADSAVQDYIAGLLSSVQRFETSVETGNELLDGLFSQKLAEASSYHISVDLILDFRSIHFVEPMDLCTIFGNAMDNALEACQAVPDPDQRRISIRSQITAGQLIISVGNSYCAPLQFSDGLPKSSKSSGLHGIGLRSLQRALHRYEGVMDINLKTPQWFQLTLLIPLPSSC